MSQLPIFQGPKWVVLFYLAAVVHWTAHPLLAAKEPKKRVAVIAFENKSGVTSSTLSEKEEQLGNGMTEKLIEALLATQKFIVLERLDLKDVLDEQYLNATAPGSPEQQARITSAQAFIRGAITSIEDTGGRSGGIGVRGMIVGGSSRKVTVKVNIRIIDIITGQILDSQTVEGAAKSRGLGVLGGSNSGVATFSTRQKSPLNQAVDDAIIKAVERIVTRMENVPWQGCIARVSGQQIFVNAGEQENVEEGLRLRVFEKGKDLIDPETNENLGSLDEEIGLIEIEHVSPRFSVARIVNGQGFSPGNIVKPAELPAPEPE